jgi:hypothetical protein
LDKETITYIPGTILSLFNKPERVFEIKNIEKVYSNYSGIRKFFYLHMKGSTPYQPGIFAKNIVENNFTIDPGKEFFFQEMERYLNAKIKDELIDFESLKMMNASQEVVKSEKGENVIANNTIPSFHFYLPLIGLYRFFSILPKFYRKIYLGGIVTSYLLLYIICGKSDTTNKIQEIKPIEPILQSEPDSQLNPVIPSSSDTSVEPPKEEPAKFYQIGQSVKTNKFELSIPSTRSTMNIGSGFGAETPAQGGFFLIIKFKYKNISSAPIGSFETPSFELYDPSGNQVEEAISAAFQLALEDPSGKKLASNLNPGISITESKVFEVSNEYWKGGKNWVIILDADEKISFKVK